jgi:glycine cleavage system aminomethyltransferase T
MESTSGREPSCVNPNPARVKTLDFVSIDKAERSDRFHPVLKSPMHRRLTEAGAVFEERDGWLVATHVPGQERHRIAIRDVTASYRVEEADGSAHIEFGDGEHGVVPPTGEGQTLVASYRSGAGGHEGFMDASAAWGAIEVDGPGASTVMRRLTELDLDELPVVGPLARVRALVARPGDERYLIVMPQEYGHYLWEAVVDAAHPLGGGPTA